MKQSVPFDPPYEEVTHEYRVTVNDGGLLFQTSWYIDVHAENVRNSLVRAYPNGRVILLRRRVVGDSEIVQ